MMLYKYVDWTNKYTKGNLKTCKLGFNTPENFNDPFDTFPYYSIDNRDSFISNLIKKNLEYQKHQSYNYELIKCFSDKDITIIQSDIDKSEMYNSRYGITCFSKTANNILMWSHYANKHRGICLGFDIPKECLDFFDEEKILSTLQGKLLKINYTDKRYCWNISKEDQENILTLLSSKYTDWAYEQEYRIFLRCDNLGTFPTGLKYKSKYLKEIILGSNMTLKDYIDFYNIKKEKFPELLIKISNLSQKQYGLELSPLSQEEQVNLFNNYNFLKNNFLKNNIPDNIFKNISKVTPKRIKKEWLSSLNNFPIYAIKTYWNKFLLEQDLETSILSKNDLLINSLLFIKIMQDNLYYKLKIIAQ